MIYLVNLYQDKILLLFLLNKILYYLNINILLKAVNYKYDDALINYFKSSPSNTWNGIINSLSCSLKNVTDGSLSFKNYINVYQFFQ